MAVGNLFCKFADMMHEDILRAVEVMRDGGVILYPTDTIWGIGCDATNTAAVRRVYEIKRRSDSKALISLVGSKDALREVVGDIPHEAEILMETAGRPLTIVFPHADLLSTALLADDGSAGLRLTSEAYSAALCRGLGVPVVSTSANVSGSPSPRFFSEIDPDIINAVDYVAMYRRDDTTPSAPSTVIKINPDGSITTLRP